MGRDVAMELRQRKDPAYGLNTYVDFESEVEMKGRIIDPTSIIEIIGRLKKKKSSGQLLILDVSPLVAQPTKSLKMKRHEGRAMIVSTPFRLRFRTKEEEKTLKRIEDKKGKATFETIPRIVYFAPKNIYNRDLPNRGVYGYLAQFNNDDQNIGKIDKIRSKVDWDAFPFILPNRRLFWKRVASYDEYRRRFIPEETIVGKIYNSYPLRFCFWHQPMLLSSTEFASMFHIPTNVVLTSATMDRIESKRLSPPANLPG